MHGWDVFRPPSCLLWRWATSEKKKIEGKPESRDPLYSRQEVRRVGGPWARPQISFSLCQSSEEKGEKKE